MKKVGKDGFLRQTGHPWELELELSGREKNVTWVS